MTIDDLKESIRARLYRVSRHAYEEADADRLSVREVVASVALHGEIIEDYPDRDPAPRCLVLSRTPNGIPVHTVWEDEIDGDRVALVTVYRPDPQEWIEWRRRR